MNGLLARSLISCDVHPSGLLLHLLFTFGLSVDILTFFILFSVLLTNFHLD